MSRNIFSKAFFLKNEVSSKMMKFGNRIEFQDFFAEHFNIKSGI